jgi:enamine deaminase RidA (YjgF/YER057c/UK114 family)
MFLPAAPAALGAYVPAVRAGSLVFTAGQLPLRDGSLISSGLVNDQVSVAVARECAKQAALNALAAASTVCDLDEVSWAVKLVGYVASARGFSDQPAVMNAASEVLTTAFGEAGAHAREAVGVAALPMDAPVELSLVLSL